MEKFKLGKVDVKEAATSLQKSLQNIIESTNTVINQIQSFFDLEWGGGESKTAFLADFEKWKKSREEYIEKLTHLSYNLSNEKAMNNPVGDFLGLDIGGAFDVLEELNVLDDKAIAFDSSFDGYAGPGLETDVVSHNREIRQNCDRKVDDLIYEHYGEANKLLTKLSAYDFEYISNPIETEINEALQITRLSQERLNDFQYKHQDYENHVDWMEEQCAKVFGEISSPAGYDYRALPLTRVNALMCGSISQEHFLNTIQDYSDIEIATYLIHLNPEEHKVIFAKIGEEQKQNVIEEMKNIVFEERFGTELFKNDDMLEYMVQKTDASAIAVLRLTLGDEYFSPTELKNSDILMEQYNMLSKKYPNFPIVIGNNKKGIATVYFGGDQDWFRLNDHYAKYYGGCGPVAASNVVANLALQDKEVARKLGLGNLHKSRVATMREYLHLMEDVSETVEIIEVPIAAPYADNTRSTEGFPPSFGILAEQKLQNDLKIYGEMHGVEITGQRIDQNKKNLEIPGLIETEPYNIKKLEAALSEGKPVTFFNALTDIPMYDTKGNNYIKNDGSNYEYSRHWVSVVGKEGDKMNISTWGEERMIKYGDLQNAQRNNPLQGWNAVTIYEAKVK